MPIHEMVNGHSERVYGGFCSGDYPIDLQEMLYRDYRSTFNGRRPLLLYVSVFIDGGLMNSTHTRYAIPIVLTILNDSEKTSTLVGFCSKKMHISDEEIDNILQRNGITAKTNRSDLKILAWRQANWDCITVTVSLDNFKKDKRNKEGLMFRLVLEMQLNTTKYTLFLLIVLEIILKFMI